MLNEIARKKVIEFGSEFSENYDGITIEMIQDVYDKLPANEKEIIEPILVGTDTMASVARRVGMSPTQVRNIYNKNLQKLYHRSKITYRLVESED